MSVLFAAALGASAIAAGQPTMLYVSPQGRDTWSGRLPAPKSGDGPFATLERARDEIRKMKKAGAIPKGGFTVEVRAGVYELPGAFELTAEDSGTDVAPIVYRARKGEEVRLVGGRQVTGLKPVTDPAILSRLDEGARGKVLQADLRALGITDFGDVVAPGKRLEVFFQDRPMTLARWPNEGFTHIVDLVGGAPHAIHGAPGDKIGRFTYEGDRPKRWVGEKDLWLEGYWFWDWSDQRQRVESIDTDKHIISLMPPYHTYGYRKGQWYFAFNALSELDSPGEWYLDRDTGILYFWPTAPIAKSKLLVSIIPTLVTMNDVSHVTLRGMILEACRSTAVVMNGGTGNLVAACTIRNTGADAVSVNGGSQNGVVGCDIYATADGCITLSGGDRSTLTPAGHFADNNHCHHYARWSRMYHPAIVLAGVGNRATHNLIDNAPHMAMGFSGNDHLIEFNEIHSVCYEANDAGAIYAGRQWAHRGTVIRYNYFHDISGFEGRGCVGVYLDDQWCGTTIFGNLFYNVTRAAMIGGGRDCTIENNVFVDCVPATHVDARGLNWAAGGFDGLKAGLDEVPYKTPPWSTRYPQLVTILDDEPMAPKGNTIARNILVGGRWGDFEAAAKPLVTFTDNLLDQDPLFVDRAHLNFQLRPESPAWKLGFQRIPIEKMGLYRSDLRASWPVVSAILPTPKPPAPAQRAKRTPPVVFRVAHVKSPLTIDSADPAKAMLLEQGVNGEKVKPMSHAWLAHDGRSLFVVVDNAVDPGHPVSTAHVWGKDDAVEIAVRDPAGGEKALILVLRGYPNGFFESSAEAGAPDAAVKRAAQGVQFKAHILNPGRWTCEWRIPFASLGLDPAKQKRVEFNLSVRKIADDLWVMWLGTGGCTWDVDYAGFLEFGQ
jgi:hypothetical protein